MATGDRDLFQVIDDARDVRVLYCGKGVANLEVLDDAAIVAKYGVPAGGYADLAALRGDPSDGLPGVPGVGEKTAARLVVRYGGLDGILAALRDPESGFAPGLRGKLAAAADYLAVAPKVVQVARDVALPPLDTTLPSAPREPERLIELAETWGVAGAGAAPRRRQSRQQALYGEALRGCPCCLSGWPRHECGRHASTGRGGVRRCRERHDPHGRVARAVVVRRVPDRLINAVNSTTMTATTNNEIGATNVSGRKPATGFSWSSDTRIAYMPVKCMPLTATPMISAATKRTAPLRRVTVNQRATVAATTAIATDAATKVRS